MYYIIYSLKGNPETFAIPDISKKEAEATVAKLMTHDGLLVLVTGEYNDTMRAVLQSAFDEGMASRAGPTCN